MEEHSEEIRSERASERTHKKGEEYTGRRRGNRDEKRFIFRGDCAAAFVAGRGEKFAFFVIFFPYP